MPDETLEAPLFEDVQTGELYVKMLQRSKQSKEALSNDYKKDC